MKVYQTDKGTCNYYRVSYLTLSMIFPCPCSSNMTGPLHASQMECEAFSKIVSDNKLSGIVLVLNGLHDHHFFQCRNIKEIWFMKLTCKTAVEQILAVVWHLRRREMYMQT
ncbi:hypothetical protein TNIN_296351 [Trichonephila inaurata madagascariensis]|uniref:Uncharacterized protein n=1 Tax=Trichonephila inaurata madagascariensis TaxID=2747483 RepID=A0A8X6XSP4_9ARAC|nr:hypothetical protein TNIN_296351 [Trichonephila inaurata madagascariensis]